MDGELGGLAGARGQAGRGHDVRGVRPGVARIDGDHARGPGERGLVGLALVQPGALGQREGGLHVGHGALVVALELEIQVDRATGRVVRERQQIGDACVDLGWREIEGAQLDGLIGDEVAAVGLDVEDVESIGEASVHHAGRGGIPLGRFDHTCDRGVMHAHLAGGGGIGALGELDLVATAQHSHLPELPGGDLAALEHIAPRVGVGGHGAGLPVGVGAWRDAGSEDLEARLALPHGGELDGLEGAHDDDIHGQFGVRAEFSAWRGHEVAGGVRCHHGRRCVHAGLRVDAEGAGTVVGVCDQGLDGGGVLDGDQRVCGGARQHGC